MMRFRLRTLLIVLAILPPLIAWWGWPAMQRILWPPKPANEWLINGGQITLKIDPGHHLEFTADNKMIQVRDKPTP
jgi:hypothetical protein